MPNLLLVALNAKYVHTSLAVRSLQAFIGGQAQIFESPMQEPVHKLAHRLFDLAPPNALVGFSCYLWNIGLVEQLCDRLKKMRGDIRIVLGGPEVSFDAPDVLRRNPAVDYVISGEGELPLRALLKATDSACIPSVYTRLGGQDAHQRLELDELPFPYTAGVEGLETRILYYESSRGCPFHCRFCLSADTGVRFLSLERTLSELTVFAARNVRQVKLVDRTFNADPARARKIWEHLIALDTATNFHFEIAAHLLDEEDFALLARAPKGRFQFEIGVQSTHAPAREAVCRTESVERIKAAAMRLKALGNIHLHLDLIAGLPLEDFETFGKSYDEVAALRPHALQLGVLKGLKGSGVRRDASRYGLVFSASPPYDALRSGVLSPKALIRLTRMADIASRFVESGHARATVALLCTLFTPFALLTALETYLSDIPKEPQAIREALAGFSRTVSLEKDTLSDCLAYDWLLPQKRGCLPPYIGCELTRSQEQYTRIFYRDKAALYLPHLSGPPWRFAHLHPVSADVTYLISSGELRPQAGYLLFDYARHTAPLFVPGDKL